MKLTLRVWRQKNAGAEGHMSTYEVDGISPDMSFLEMLDTLNERLILQGEEPVAFDHDCREGICGACSLVINGEAHATPVPKADADYAFEHAECIGCGACVAACPNGAAMLFTSAKVNHLNVLPQGAPERETRVLDMVAQMDAEGFGGCTLTGECATACPKGIPLTSITHMNKEWLRATRKAARR
jgi:succinate dehydrogenase / fumarate reductase iron-sulfur subunit